MESIHLTLPLDYENSPQNSSDDSSQSRDLDLDMIVRPTIGGKKPFPPREVQQSSISKEEPRAKNGSSVAENGEEDDERPPIVFSSSLKKKPSASNQRVYYLKESIFGAPVDAKKKKKIRVIALTNKEGKIVLAHNDFFAYMGLRGEAKNYTKNNSPYVETAYYDGSSRKVIHLDACIKLVETFCKNSLPANKDSVRAFGKLKDMLDTTGLDLTKIADERPEEDRPVPAKRSSKKDETTHRKKRRDVVSDSSSSSEDYTGEPSSDDESSSSSEEDIIKKKKKTKKVSKSHHSGESRKKESQKKSKKDVTPAKRSHFKISENNAQEMVQRTKEMVEASEKIHMATLRMEKYLTKKFKSEH